MTLFPLAYGYPDGPEGEAIYRQWLAERDAIFAAAQLELEGEGPARAATTPRSAGPMTPPQGTGSPMGPETPLEDGENP